VPGAFGKLYVTGRAYLAPSGDVHQGRFPERDLANAPITVPVDDGFKWEYDIAPRMVATSSPQVIRALVSQGLKSQMPAGPSRGYGDSRRSS
jgi:hypothetical protein